jgi:hypothetical protein
VQIDRDVPRWSTTCWLTPASWARRHNQGGRQTCLLLVEDVPPPKGVRGGDPSTVAEALACRDAALRWVRWHAMH